ncbi:MAG: recombinase family protein [Desulfobulbaceae bacterium]|nr:recombinase family protein [Desulfobulbaceae bacterium]
MLIGYARVSTIDQNPQRQTDALEQAGCEQIFTEKISGAKKNRPELRAALDYMREGDTLVVWKMSRRARSLRQIIATAHDFEQRKVKLKVLTQNIDTGTAEGRFFHMTAAFDEFQRELIVENNRAGLAVAHRRGRRGGRPPSMTDDKIRNAESMIKDTDNYPFITDIIKQLEIGRTTFYRHFPQKRISELRLLK